MKIKAIILTCIVALAPILLMPNKAIAGGGSFATDLIASSATAVADGSSTITFTYRNYVYVCSSNGDSTGDPNYCSDNGYGTASQQPINLGDSLPITVSGSGNILSATSAPGSSGSFTLKSTTAETKTVALVTPHFPDGQAPVIKSTQVTFTAKPAPAAQKTPAPTPPAAAKTNTAPASAPTPPATPTVVTISAAGATQDTAKPISIPTDKPLVLSGKTVPNGVVTLTIHSTPRTVTTTADSNGDWSYTITGLETGDHTIAATATDPTTKLTSPQTTLASFTVTAAQEQPDKAATTQPTTQKNNISPLVIIGMIVVALAAIGVGVWLFIRHRMHSKQANIAVAGGENEPHSNNP